MVFSVIKCVNGNFAIHAEGFTDLAKAKTNFHGLCQTLWNAPDVLTACIKIIDENLDMVEGYREFIYHIETPSENIEVE